MLCGNSAGRSAIVFEGSDPEAVLLALRGVGRKADTMEQMRQEDGNEKKLSCLFVGEGVPWELFTVGLRLLLPSSPTTVASVDGDEMERPLKETSMALASP
jgi:hypothetical protein